MRRQPGVQDFIDQRMLIQIFRYFLSVETMTFYTQMQGFDSPQHQKTFLWSQCCSGCELVKCSCFPNASSLITKAPAITSECPPKYLVAECITISAPKSKGFCK